MPGVPDTGQACPVEKRPRPPTPPELVAVTDCCAQPVATKHPASKTPQPPPRTQAHPRAIAPRPDDAGPGLDEKGARGAGNIAATVGPTSRLASSLGDK